MIIKMDRHIEPIESKIKARGEQVLTSLPLRKRGLLIQLIQESEVFKFDNYELHNQPTPKNRYLARIYVKEPTEEDLKFPDGRPKPVGYINSETAFLVHGNNPLIHEKYHPLLRGICKFVESFE